MTFYDFYACFSDKKAVYLHYIKQWKDMKIKAYSKSELARAYAPDIDIRSALNRLSYWIRYNKKLSEELYLDGYNRYQKVFTVRQVELIFHYLGEP